MGDKGDDEVAHGQQDSSHVNSSEYDPRDPEDEVYADDALFDEQGRFDLTKLLPNSKDNPIKYIYKKDSTGRVMEVEARFKVQRPEQMDHNDHNDHKDNKDREEPREQSNKRNEGNHARKKE